ncbi:Slc4a1, partial [Symbiodinium sp. KB8]
AAGVLRIQSGYIRSSSIKDLGPLEFTGKVAGGLRLDLRRRAPLYGSDWTDAFKAENLQKSVSSILYLFIAALAPAITFGSRFLDGTNGQFGVLEMIMSTCVSGLLFSTFSGQPLSILGATGPFLAYSLVVYDLADAMELEFLPYYFWVCMWSSVFTILVAVFDLCALMKHVTMFSEDIFAGLISLIFIIDGILPILRNFIEETIPLRSAMFETLLFVITFGGASYLSYFRRTPWTVRSIRNLVANFAVTITLVIASAVGAIYTTETNLRMLEVEAELAPALTLATGEKRPWVVNPMGIEKDFPAWGIAYAILPAIGFAVLGYLDQNLTSVIVNRPSNGLSKPPGYHLDLFVRGALTTPVCAVLGLPLSVASTVPSITHVISLTTYEVQQLPQGERKVPTKVVEQRATNFLIHVLIGCALFMAPVLKFIPRAVLQGVFFYMGIASLTGNNLFDRMKLWLIWDSAKYPSYHYIQKLPVSRVHLYTFVQFICLAILYGLKEIKETAVVFPFFMASLAIIRKAMRWMFSEEELKQLDGHPAEDPDEVEEPEPAKPDLLNLEPTKEEAPQEVTEEVSMPEKVEKPKSEEKAAGVLRIQSGYIRSSSIKDLGPLEFTGKVAGGLRLDLRRRAPLYGSDWTDAFKAENLQKSVSSILYLFIAALAPAITFGSRFLDGTNGQFGVLEMIMSTCVSGLLFSTFSGQPLSILGATGPFLAYSLVVYDLADAMELEFLPYYFWVCMWSSVFTILVAVFDLCALMKHVTMFSEDIFAGLISLIFIIDGILPILRNFIEETIPLRSAMFETLLFVITFGGASYLSYFRRTPWTVRSLRNLVANFAVTITLVIASAIGAIYTTETNLRMLEVEAELAPALTLATGEKRPWVVNPMGIEKDFPAWGIAYAILPAIGFAVLGYLDQNLTSVIVNRPSNGLSKPPGYHLDRPDHQHLLSFLC